MGRYKSVPVRTTQKPSRFASGRALPVSSSAQGPSMTPTRKTDTTSPMNDAVMRTAVAAIGSRPAEASPMNRSVRPSVTTAAPRGRLISASVTLWVTRSSGSSKVPMKSRMPAADTKIPRMPSGTPQRNWASRAIQTKAKSPPAKAMTVPRIGCSGLPTRGGVLGGSFQNAHNDAHHPLVAAGGFADSAGSGAGGASSTTGGGAAARVLTSFSSKSLIIEKRPSGARQVGITARQT